MTHLKKAALLVALVALVSAGCSNRSKGTSGAPEPAPSTQGNPPTPVPAPTPSPAPDGETPTVGSKVPVPPIPDKGSAGWAPVKLSATDIASKMDAAMAGLKNVSCTVTVVGTTPGGSIQPSTFPSYIKNSKIFKLSYMRLADDVPETGMATADGTDMVVLEKDGMSAPRKVASSRPWDSGALVAQWPGTFAEHVFDGLALRPGLWAALVKGWVGGVGGYKLTLEERETPYKGRIVKNYRYVAERPAGKSKQTEQVEVVVDGQLYLPVTIRTVAYDKRGRVSKIQWSADWRNNQVLEPKMFLIKK